MEKVFLKFGETWQDYTSLVRWDEFSYTLRGFASDYRNAENEARVVLNFDSDLYTVLISSNTYIPVKITDDADVPILIGEAQSPLSRAYTGELVESFLSLTVRDFSRRLSRPVRDASIAEPIPSDELVLFGAKVMDPANPGASIVHQLILKAGFTLSDIASVTIPTVIPAFAPTEESDILQLLSTMLYEYGYAPDWDSDGKFHPILWRENPVPSITVTDADIRTPVTITASGVEEYTGVKLTYFEMKVREDTGIYSDADLPFAENDEFGGLVLAPGAYYPPLVNVTDPVTGQPTVVYQSYGDAGISYFTNKTRTDPSLADYNWKAFPSDFSDIVATRYHTMDAYWDPGIIQTQNLFFSKKARYVFYNPTGAPLKLYWVAIHADVYYLSSSRTFAINMSAAERFTEKYQATFIYDETNASLLAKHLASRHAMGDIEYSFSSDNKWMPGTNLRIMLDDGSIADVKVRELFYNPQMLGYSYKVKAYDTATLPIIEDVVTEVGNNTPAPAVTPTVVVSTTNMVIPFNSAGTALDYTNAEIKVRVLNG